MVMKCQPPDFGHQLESIGYKLQLIRIEPVLIYIYIYIHNYTYIFISVYNIDFLYMYLYAVHITEKKYIYIYIYIYLLNSSATMPRLCGGFNCWQYLQRLLWLLSDLAGTLQKGGHHGLEGRSLSHHPVARIDGLFPLVGCWLRPKVPGPNPRA